MRKLLITLLLVLTPGCVVYESEPEYPPGTYYYVAGDVYYREVLVNGVYYREYYHWHPDYGWRFHERIRARPFHR